MTNDYARRINIKHMIGMKNLIKTVMAGIVIIFLGTTAGSAQEVKKSDTLVVQTSAVCGMCKERIEQGLAFGKGIKKATLDEKSKEVTVLFNPSKTTPEAIRTAISKLGYDADGVAADPDAYKKLPACCKKDQTSH